MDKIHVKKIHVGIAAVGRAKVDTPLDKREGAGGGPGTDAVLQGHAIEKLHGDEGLTVLVTDVVDGADVGMIQGGSRLGFALKACQSLRVPRNIFWEKFQRDEAVQASVFCFVNDSHATTAELVDDAVVRDSLANHEVAVMVGGMRGQVERL